MVECSKALLRGLGGPSDLSELLKVKHRHKSPPETIDRYVWCRITRIKKNEGGGKENRVRLTNETKHSI